MTVLTSKMCHWRPHFWWMKIWTMSCNRSRILRWMLSLMLMNNNRWWTSKLSMIVNNNGSHYRCYTILKPWIKPCKTSTWLSCRLLHKSLKSNTINRTPWIRTIKNSTCCRWMPNGECRSLSSIGGSLRTRSSTRTRLTVINSLLSSINSYQTQINLMLRKTTIMRNRMNNTSCKTSSLNKGMSIKNKRCSSSSTCLMSLSNSRRSPRAQASMWTNKINHSGSMCPLVSISLRSFSHHPREHVPLHRNKQRYQTSLKWHRFKAMWSSTKKTLIENKRLMRDRHDLRS
jgi:hypothetical protein